MVDVPELPPSGPLRVLAVAGSVSLVALAVAAALAMRSGNRRVTAWAVAPLLLGAASFTLGRHLHPLGHVVLSLLTLAVALRNAFGLPGGARIASAVAAAAWLVALVAARRLFG